MSEGKRRLSLLPPDDGGWYVTGKPDWVDLAPIRDSSCRAWHIMRNLVYEKSPSGSVRSLTLEELCKMLPMVAADGTVKPSSLGRLRDIFRDLSDIGLISDRDGNPITTSSSAKAALQSMSIRINDWPAEGVEYDGWRNAYNKLDAIREGRPFDKPVRPDTKSAEEKPPGRKPRKKAAPKSSAEPAPEAAPPASPADAPTSPKSLGLGLKSGWKSNQDDGGGWISNQVGWESNRAGWIPNHDRAADLGERDPSSIPSASIPSTTAPSASSVPHEAAPQREAEEKIDSDKANDTPSAALPAPRTAQAAGSVEELDAELAAAADRIVAAWTAARTAAGIGPHRRAGALGEFRTSAAALVKAGKSVAWLVAVAAWMGGQQPAWTGLGEATKAQYAGAPEEPKVRAAVRADATKCPRHPVMPKDCTRCAREEMDARRDSEPGGLDVAGFLAELGIKAGTRG
ncbi:hypothetical protein [Kitasatospora sp. NPDC057223]|uniref:hypothetical protein n=1 Tax=Kitasatospora sp. NPDC057223 TaxID=3346055 RepID=UPI00363BE654